jgi:hypothetical protein
MSSCVCKLISCENSVKTRTVLKLNVQYVLDEMVKRQKERAMPTYAIVLFILACCFDILGVILLIYQTFATDPALDTIDEVMKASVEDAKTDANST